MTTDRPVVLFVTNPHPLLQEKLRQAGMICITEPDKSREEIEENIEGITGLIINSRFIIDRDFLDKAKSLKFIGRLGSGMESIDTEYAAVKGIRCFNSPEGNRDAVGEHALGMLLCLMNRICLADRDIRNGLWEREANRGTEIRGKTVGIIGYGNTGSAFARKLSGFEAKVIAYDKYKTSYSDDYCREADMNTLFAEADIVSLHLPLTEETQHLAGNAFFENFRKNIYFINTSRGSIVDTSSLVKHIESGKISGAALDVLEYEDHNFVLKEGSYEDASFRFLQTSERVILTPHVAGWTMESKLNLASVLADKIISYYCGELQN